MFKEDTLKPLGGQCTKCLKQKVQCIKCKWLINKEMLYCGLKRIVQITLILL